MEKTEESTSTFQFQMLNSLILEIILTGLKQLNYFKSMNGANEVPLTEESYLVPRENYKTRLEPTPTPMSVN